MRIAFITNVDWFFISHRLPLAERAINEGHEVWVITKDTGRLQELANMGIHVIDFPFERSGTNPLHELSCILGLRRIYKKVRPDVVHNITLKASLLSSVAAKLTGFKNVVNAISGFGYTFTSEQPSTLQRIVTLFLKLAFRSKHFAYIFQNPDDAGMFKNMNLVNDNQVYLIKGSGCDLNVYSYTEPLIEAHPIVFLLPARMLRDKGVIEYIEAAKILQKEIQGKAKFLLAGMCDDNNKAGIKESELLPLLIDDYIVWLGHQKDMLSVYKSSDVVVLPSYREGLPKSLIEACAIGRPIISTDVPGCRECVEDGVNGFLVPARTSTQLADAIKRMVYDENLRISMGKASRKLAESEFSIESVVEKHFKIYRAVSITK
jgi:glycosyltransferase involved in cell wall biosynthesis